MIDWTLITPVSLWQTIATIAVIIVAFFIIVRLLMRFWPWLRKVMELTAALAQLPAFITRTDQTLREQDEQIAEIHKETNYNGETSMKDAVRRVELGVKGIYDRLDRADVSDVAQAAISTANRDRIDRLERARPPRPRPQKPKEN